MASMFPFLPVLALALPPAALELSAPDPPASPAAIELAFRPYQDWKVILPEEQFATVSEGIAFPHAGGNTLAARLEGTVLWVDRDGDGECDARVEPLEPGQTGLMVFHPRGADGAERSYAVRLSSEGKWTYSASGAMVGEYRGVRIQLIDQNNNGRFADFGRDAMIVGSGRAASFLSRVIRIDDELFSIDVAEDGSRIELTSFQGEAGTLDLASRHESKARLRAVVIRSRDGEISFEVSRETKGLKVPAGAYLVHSGRLVLGKGIADLSTGRSPALSVAPGETTAVEWGGPVEAEFRYLRQGESLKIGPDDIRYFGRVGEEYSNFLPLGTSPEFVIKDANTGEVLVNAKFPGSC